MCKPLAAPYPPLRSAFTDETEGQKEKTDKKTKACCKGVDHTLPPSSIPPILIPTPPTHAAGPHLQVVDEPRVVELRLLGVDGLGVDAHLPVSLRVHLHPEKIRPRAYYPKY